MKNIIFVIFFIAISTISCEKENVKSETSYTYILKELRTEYIFNVGSYWVFQDSAGNLDSIVLSHVETGFTSFCPDNGCSINEYTTMIYNNVTRNMLYNHYFMMDFVRYNGGGDWGQDGQPIFIYDAQLGYEFNGVEVTGKQDSLEIMNNVYYDVIRMTIDANRQFQKEFEYNTDLYFAPHVGLIKKVSYDTVNGIQTWELLRYQIK